MISDIFRKDYRAMTAQGVEFTPEDIVRLNALAVKVSLSQRAADTVHLPRVAFLGGERVKGERVKGAFTFSPFHLFTLSPVILREPTVAHELWIEEASRWIDCRDDRNFLWLHGYALSRPAEKLADALKPKKLIRAVYAYAAKRLSRFTTAQLTAAVEYALVGNDWKAGEKARGEEKAKARGEGEDKLKSQVEVEERTDKIHSSTSTSNFNYSPAIGLLVNAKALRLPITVEEANRMTASELAEAIARSRLYDGKFDADEARKTALGEYVRAREEIRARQATR